MCSFNYKFSEIHIPKYLKALTVGILVLLIKSSIRSNGLFFLVVRILHFLGFKSTFLVSSHLLILSRVDCKDIFDSLKFLYHLQINSYHF